MKTVKILLGVLAALWALALVPKLLKGLSTDTSSSALSYGMGSIAGILIASAISIVLFRSAFRD